MIDLVIKACAVQRYHMFRVAHRESVGEHSFMVAQLARYINETEDTGEVLMCALDHDLPECVTGDIPGNVKHLCGEAFVSLEADTLRRAGVPQHYSPEVQRIVKLADVMAGYAYCRQEVLGRGNASLHPVMLKYRAYTLDLVERDVERNLFEIIEGVCA